MPLTPKQERFCQEYLVDLNGTQAAIRAGYSPKTANEIAAENLAKPSIVARVAELQAERATRTQVTADRVVRELARIAFLDPRRVMAWGPDGVTLRPADELDPDDAAAVRAASQTVTQHGGTIKLELAPKIDALRLLGDHLGMWKAPASNGDPVGELLRQALQDDLVARRTGGRPPAAIEQPGPAGGGGPAAGVADAAAPGLDQRPPA